MDKKNFQKTPWVVWPRYNPNANLRLFCFPYAGAGASVYFPWVRLLADHDIDVCNIQLPGRENRLREPAITSFPALMEALLAAIETLLDRDFCFFGHSLGGLVSFELTRALRRNQMPMPRRLFASACRAPQALERHSLHQLPQKEFVKAVAEYYSGFSTAIMQNPDLMELILPTLRSDFALIENYTYQKEEALPCPISCFAGSDDHLVTAALNGWREHTTSEFKLKLFNGGHFFVNFSSTEIIREIVNDIRCPAAAGAPHRDSIYSH